MNLPGPGCYASAISYAADNVISSLADFNGNRKNFTHDTRGLETQRVEALTSGGGTTSQTRTIDTTWHTTFRLPTEIVERNGGPGSAILRTTSMGYDTAGNMLTRTVTDVPLSRSRIWTYTYNANGQVLTVDGPRTDVSDVTTYIYYANHATCTATLPGATTTGCRGQVNTITNALSHLTTIAEYNAHGQPLSITDPNGLVTTLAYDTRQRLTSRNVGGETTSYTYDNAGQLTRVSMPDGSFLEYSYDAAHRLIQIQDNLGNRIAYTLDAMGNRTLEQMFDPLNALAQTRSRVYSNLNRLFQEISAQNHVTQYGYDNQGNLTSVDGPLAGTVDLRTQTYDALNRLATMVDPAGGGTTTYSYNALDQLASVKDARDLTSTYTNDALNNLNQLASPDTGTTNSTYDAAGNLLTQTDAKSQQTIYTYDALNRVATITYHGGVVHTYQYDQGTNQKGRLTQITEPNSTTVYAYDQKGRLTSETRTINAVAYITGYRYDGFGRLDRITYPGGRQVDYTFDGLGRVSQVTATKDTTQTVVSSVAYHPFGAAKSFTFGNGQGYTRTIDQDGRVASYTLGSQTFALGYDEASRVSFINDVGTPANSITYGYDNLDRLTSASVPGTPFGFSYDAVGNRLSKSAGAAFSTYTPSATSNRHASITPPSGPVRNYIHDLNGSITNDAINTFGYDTRGRLNQAISVLGTSTYQVNSLGQRIRKMNPLGDTVYHYDSQGRLIAESAPGGAIQKEYIYLGDMPVAVIQ